MLLKLCFKLFLAIVLLQGCSDGTKSASFESQGPDFNLSTLQQPENEIQLSRQLDNGNFVMLAFWATWCPPCVEEVPELKKIQSNYRNLKLFAINVGEKRAVVEKFAEKHRIDYEVLLDEDENVAKSYNISGLPVIVILAKSGEIIYYGFNIPDLDALLTEKNI